MGIGGDEASAKIEIGRRHDDVGALGLPIGVGRIDHV